ncbi:SDR family NAD(P)-dependent oxidoreductase [Streptomyces reniochalinae]|uniref:SDR family NAD(P)-dependent oxidoreductase n=1 Tax=Streptomyces reniochalinae TaxID=2250578 RepID=A0A367F678_9ACTN|nr:glucose 1-dehydrogenase [Streptomyces reniochalinae]RCG25187.1 SDR family NAD(P)-dependent oxidoreductase [Streptomyces reniochalinae]
MTRFEGYAALVTGAGQGIGAAVAHRLAAEGARVLVTDLDAERARAVAAAVRADGGTAEAHGCDVRDAAAVESAVTRAAETFGSLDVLVNNAYSCHRDPDRFEEWDEAAWYEDFEVTLHGAARCARAALPLLAAAPGRGAIVSVGSVNAEAHFGDHAYSAAKAGLASLTRTLAVESAPRGVRVNLVEPGTVRTDVWRERAAMLAEVSAHYPLGRVGEPSDIAAAVAFLASSDAAWITGVTLPVDGGLLVSNLAMNRTMAHG